MHAQVIAWALLVKGACMNACQPDNLHGLLNAYRHALTRWSCGAARRKRTCNRACVACMATAPVLRVCTQQSSLAAPGLPGSHPVFCTPCHPATLPHSVPSFKKRMRGVARDW
eukprot:365401-Chlamydomonas_euryale.AAC.3